MFEHEDAATCWVAIEIENTPQRVLPTFPVIIGMGAGGMPSFGDINWAMLVHGEQSIEVFGEIPPDGTVESVTKLVGIYDKGSGSRVAGFSFNALMSQGGFGTGLLGREQ